MKIVDDICYPDSDQPMFRILEARPLDSTRMEFLFSIGERRIWNSSKIRQAGRLVSFW